MCLWIKKFVGFVEAKIFAPLKKSSYRDFSFYKDNVTIFTTHKLFNP